MRQFLLIVIGFALGFFLFSKFVKADSLGLDYSIAPGSMPQVGADYTRNYNAAYIDFGVVTNRQTTTPQLSAGVQLDVINIGLASAANVTGDGTVAGLGGLEVGFTKNLDELFYVKANNTFLRDTDSHVNYGLGLSAGVNF